MTPLHASFRHRYVVADTPWHVCTLVLPPQCGARCYGDTRTHTHTHTTFGIPIRALRPHATALQSIPESVLLDAPAAVLHSVITCRALGTLSPHTRTLSQLRLAFPHTADAAVDSVVDDACRRIVACAIHTPAVAVTITWYEKRSRPVLFGFTSVVDRVPFETWKWTIHVTSSRRAGTAHDAASSHTYMSEEEEILACGDRLRKTMVDIAMVAAQNVKHLPVMLPDEAPPVASGLLIDVQPAHTASALPASMKAGVGGARPRGGSFEKRASFSGDP
ncbi:autophagy-related protein 101 [archaeon]|nr:MAG: autophagy-related protein 101 [archaeon]